MDIKNIAANPLPNSKYSFTPKNAELSVLFEKEKSTHCSKPLLNCSKKLALCKRSVFKCQTVRHLNNPKIKRFGSQHAPLQFVCKIKPLTMVYRGNREDYNILQRLYFNVSKSRAAYPKYTKIEKKTEKSVKIQGKPVKNWKNMRMKQRNI